MSKYIKLVEKWLANPDSVSLAELEANNRRVNCTDDEVYNLVIDAVQAVYVAALVSNGPDTDCTERLTTRARDYVAEYYNVITN